MNQHTFIHIPKCYILYKWDSEESQPTFFKSVSHGRRSLTDHNYIWELLAWYFGKISANLLYKCMFVLHQYTFNPIALRMAKTP